MKEHFPKTEDQLKIDATEVLEGKRKKKTKEEGHLRDLSVNTNHINLATVLYCKSAIAGTLKY